MSLEHPSCETLDSACGQSGHTQLAAGVAISVFTLVLAYKYLRFVFPCVTPVELQQVIQQVEEQYQQAISKDVYGVEWDDIADRRFRLSIEASIIRHRSFRASRWNTYLGLHPGLIPEIVQWYKKSETLKLSIAAALEQSIQDRLESDHRRRELRIARPFAPYEIPEALSSAFEQRACWPASSRDNQSMRHVLPYPSEKDNRAYSSDRVASRPKGFDHKKRLET
ncbi:40S ribosomal protein S6 [Marasmius crinis-equi]|uniref:40S ribosomal protein S6 n=1 Tax=Marasmius crinis-equi TaxID=585013 RepID=A0ABR3FAY5_9AGAR